MYIKKGRGPDYTRPPLVPWRRPIFPAGYPTSIVGADGFHCRVRDGNGWDTAAMTTRNRYAWGVNPTLILDCLETRDKEEEHTHSPRSTLLTDYDAREEGETHEGERQECSKALGHLVRLGYTCRHAYTRRLSTR